jgi:mannose-6-phosphate isomerase-like protein (cupin superfamily)
MPPGTTSAPGSVTYGCALTFETLGQGAAPVRCRPAEDTLLRVIAGVVLLIVESDGRVLGPGDEAIVPAGAEHRLTPAGAEARVLIGLRPARAR